MLHIGCMRNNNSRQFGLLGPDTGFDAIDDTAVARPLSRLLDKIDTVAGLPKTILYCLDPGANETISVIAGCFQGGGIPERYSSASAWWFNDHLDGMKRQMMVLASTGLVEQVRRDADRFEEFCHTPGMSISGASSAISSANGPKTARRRTMSPCWAEWSGISASAMPVITSDLAYNRFAAHPGNNRQSSCRSAPRWVNCRRAGYFVAI